MSYTDSDNESEDSLGKINSFDHEVPENPEDMERLQSVREAVKEWKLREQDKNTNTNSNAKSLKGLREYVTNSANLYYDLNSYLSTSKNKEKNMEDTMYVNIIKAIGAPGALSSPLLILLGHTLEQDLIELPFTVEPNVINSYVKDNLKVETEFPDAE